MRVVSRVRHAAILPSRDDARASQNKHNTAVTIYRAATRGTSLHLNYSNRHLTSCDRTSPGGAFPAAGRVPIAHNLIK